MEAHTSVLRQIDQKAADLDLSFKPSKWMFDGHKFIREGIQLSGGSTRPITDGGTEFLEKSLDVSLSATKAAAKKKMTDKLSYLLSTVDTLPIHGEYKLWLYRNYSVCYIFVEVPYIRGCYKQRSYHQVRKFSYSLPQKVAGAS